MKIDENEEKIKKKQFQSNQINIKKVMYQNKLKKIMDFNGELLCKVSKNANELSEEEIYFYNKIIYSNLSQFSEIVFI